jgi:dTDP-4-amino-4,6-dideoxygalactose transaminase
MIYVTSPFLPKKELFFKYLDSIYDTKTLSNGGPLVGMLSERLQERFNIKNILMVCNATIGLNVAYKTLGITKKAITTPFSYVATASSLAWSGIKPVYVDIEEESFNISIDLLEKISFKDVQCIVPVHVFGNPVDVDRMEIIASDKKVKVIYDAAHAFDVRYKGRSLLSYGDASVLSFHATKGFHTAEGGAITFADDSDYQLAKSLINFGQENGNVSAVGINAKMSELSAALGLAVLDEYDYVERRRGELFQYYEKALNKYVKFQNRLEGSTNNFNYFPVILENEAQVSRVMESMIKEGFVPRRYFYPSLHSISSINAEYAELPISTLVSSKVLCLPLYADLDIKIAEKIIATLVRSI